MKEKSQRIFKEGEKVKLVKERDLKKLGYERKDEEDGYYVLKRGRNKK